MAATCFFYFGWSNSSAGCAIIYCCGGYVGGTVACVTAATKVGGVGVGIGGICIAIGGA